MYVVVCGDLEPGVQACQGIHALVEFSQVYTLTYNQWYAQSNYICMLETPTEATLEELRQQAISRGIRTSWFREADMCNRLTACCFEPGDETKRLLSSLPLALKKRR